MKNGFSLIELLLVMAIMAILTTLTLPNLVGAQTKAKESAVRAVAHSLQLSLESYFIDHGVYPQGQNWGVLQLYQALSPEGHIQQLPKNPFTGQPYQAQEKSGQIQYSVLPEGSYRLKAYGQSTQKLLMEY